jgi:hypothetical protein
MQYILYPAHRGDTFRNLGLLVIEFPKQQDIKLFLLFILEKKLRRAVQKLSLQDRSLPNGYSPRDSLFLTGKCFGPTFRKSYSKLELA